MAGNSYSTDLGIGLTPDSVPKELFGQFSDIYGALRRLATNLDKYTGNMDIPSEARGDFGVATLRSANTNLAYFKATAAITNLHMVFLNGTGCEHAVADGFKMARGIALAPAAIDEYIPVCLFGAVTLPGVTAGTTYWLHTGLPGKLQTSPPTTGTYSQPIGFAVANDVLFINPHLVMELVP